MGRIVPQDEWKVIQNSADNFEGWKKEKVFQIQQAMLLAKKNKIEDFKKIIAKGVSFYDAIKIGEIEGIHECTLLSYLAYNNKFDYIKECEKKLPNWGFRASGFDPLDAAILGKHEDLIQYLLSKRCYNLKKAQPGFTVKLIEATLKSYLYAVEELLKAGADPEIKDDEGHTALWHNLKISPQKYEDIEIARLLLSYGAINPDDVSQEDLDENQQIVFEEAALKQVVEPEMEPDDGKLVIRHRRRKPLL